MDEKLLMMLLQLLLPLSVIVFGFRFLFTQFRILSLIRPENRRIHPDMVWLQLIPFFGSVWQFNVIHKMFASIHKELNTPAGDPVFSEDAVPVNVRPTYLIGMSFAIIFWFALIPVQSIRIPAAVIAVILWIIYFVQLGRFKRKLKKRSLLNAAG